MPRQESICKVTPFVFKEYWDPTLNNKYCTDSLLRNRKTDELFPPGSIPDVSQCRLYVLEVHLKVLGHT